MRPPIVTVSFASLAVAAMLLSSCGSKPSSDGIMAENIAPKSLAPAAESASAGTKGGNDTILLTSKPQLAYSYRYGFKLPSDQVETVQKPMPPHARSSAQRGAGYSASVDLATRIAIMGSFSLV